VEGLGGASTKSSKEAVQARLDGPSHVLGAGSSTVYRWHLPRAFSRPRRLLLGKAIDIWRPNAGEVDRTMSVVASRAPGCRFLVLSSLKGFAALPLSYVIVALVERVELPQPRLLRAFSPTVVYYLSGGNVSIAALLQTSRPCGLRPFCHSLASEPAATERVLPRQSANAGVRERYSKEFSQYAL